MLFLLALLLLLRRGGVWVGGTLGLRLFMGFVDFLGDVVDAADCDGFF